MDIQSQKSNTHLYKVIHSSASYCFQNKMITVCKSVTDSQGKGYEIRGDNSLLMLKSS